MSKRDTLLVVAKQPQPGQTKTRLCPPLSYAQAADLYECFLRDTLDIMRQVRDVESVIAFLPEGAVDYFRQLAPDMKLTCQSGASLGERLDHLLTEALVSGSQRAVVMDSDSPTLPLEYISKAFDQLAAADVVIGPTRDGGYYLIGMKQPQPHLLLEVQMSTPHVLADTLAIAESTGLIVSLLPTWYDVDMIDDLYQLDKEIAELSKNGSAAATRDWLARTGWQNPRN
jgi:rSAM/selenodomain-associated transferase 1